MKKIFKLFASLIFLVLICLSQPVKSQLSEAERKERCQNNKNRIAELEQQLQVLNAEFSQTMTEKEMEDARAKMWFIKKEKMQLPGPDKLKAVQIIFAEYNLDYYKGDGSHTARLSELEKLIAKRIKKAVSLNRPAILAKKNETDKQLAAHRNNLVALRCDNQTKKPGGACKLEGSWTQDTPGIGSTVWEIKSDGTAKETGIGYANGKATLSGNVLHIDWKTGTGYSGYYEWTLDENCSSVKGTLVFKTGRTDRLNSAVKKN